MKDRPQMQLLGMDGNIFYILGRAVRTLKQSGLWAEAEEMYERAIASHDYHEALGIISEYVQTELSEDNPGILEAEDIRIAPGFRKAIEANLDAIEAGIKPTIIQRPRYVPYKKHLKYTGFMALYVHYLYLLGKIEKREYPPRMTPHLKAELIKFDRYKAQFTLLREHGISGPEQLAAHRKECESCLAALVKQRTILNTRKKQRKPIYDALAASESLRPAMELYMQGISGMEEEAAQYMAAEDLLKKAGVPREQLMQEKAEAYANL